MDPFLVGGLVAIFGIVPLILGFLIIPIDEIIFFRGVAQPPTSMVPFIFLKLLRSVFGPSVPWTHGPYGPMNSGVLLGEAMMASYKYSLHGPYRRYTFHGGFHKCGIPYQMDGLQWDFSHFNR